MVGHAAAVSLAPQDTLQQLTVVDVDDTRHAVLLRGGRGGEGAEEEERAGGVHCG
jgi:hypothetical protein